MKFGPFALRSAAILTAMASAVLSLSACSTNTISALTPTPPSSKLPHIQFAIAAPVLTGVTAPYTSVPKAMEYWKEGGLLVDVQPTHDAAAAVQSLLAGKANIAVGASSSFYLAAAQSPQIRVVSLQEKNTWQLTAPEDSPFTSVADLTGKTIGVESLSSTSYMLARAAVNAAGLDPNKDVTWRAIGDGAAAAQAISTGSVAAYASYGGLTGVVLSALGNKPVNVQTPLDEMPGLSGIATTADYLATHRRLVLRFLRGVYEGYVFAQLNPAAALQIHWKAYPQQKPTGMSVAEAITATLPSVTSTYVAKATTGADGLIGGVPMPDVQGSIDFMVKNGVLETSLDAHKVVDLSTVSGANVFDIASIKSQADTWEP